MGVGIGQVVLPAMPHIITTTGLPSSGVRSRRGEMARRISEVSDIFRSGRLVLGKDIA